MLKLLFYTGVRVQEFVNIKVNDVYLDENKIFIEQGKGSKDRYVIFGENFKTALKVYIETIPKNRYLGSKPKEIHFIALVEFSK